MQSSCKSWNWKLRKKGQGWQVGSVGKGFGTKLTMWLSPNPRTRRLEGENWCWKSSSAFHTCRATHALGKMVAGQRMQLEDLKYKRKAWKSYSFYLVPDTILQVLLTLHGRGPDEHCFTSVGLAMRCWEYSSLVIKCMSPEITRVHSLLFGFEFLYIVYIAMWHVSFHYGKIRRCFV